ncbi:hypothetical protein FD754_022934, partial [Muntiacus muntjak]
SPDPNIDSGEALEKQREQPVGSDPGSQDNPPPQGLNPVRASEEENNADADFISVHWNDEGDTVVLQCIGANRTFETDSIQSFIRELILYGFSKIHPLGCSAGKKKMMIYHNSNFQRDKPLLLQNIQRKGDPRKIAQPIIGATMNPKRKKHAVATRHSPRFHHKTPTAHGIPGQCSFLFCVLMFMGSVAMWTGANHLPSEQGSPSGEGTSSKATSLPPLLLKGTAQGNLMTVYHTNFCIMMAAISVVAQNEAPEAEKEQEESSDYKCTLCEQFKNNPNP